MHHAAGINPFDAQSIELNSYYYVVQRECWCRYRTTTVTGRMSFELSSGRAGLDDSLDSLTRLDSPAVETVRRLLVNSSFGSQEDFIKVANATVHLTHGRKVSTSSCPAWLSWPEKYIWKEAA